LCPGVVRLPRGSSHTSCDRTARAGPAGQPPQGRRHAPRARLLRGRTGASRPDAPERGPLHHPPRRRRADPRRARAHAADPPRRPRRAGRTPAPPRPRAVATILAELGLTPPTLAAALLHDTVEDTSYSLESLRQDFGDEIAVLVDGVTKLDKVTYGEAAQAE